LHRNIATTLLGVWLLKVIHQWQFYHVSMSLSD